MTPYLGSHDTSRLVSTCDYRGQDAEHSRDVVWNKWPENTLPEAPSEDEPYQRAGVALCWLLTIPGAPMIYMGDEYGEYGGGDPDNRHMFREDELLSTRESELLTRGKMSAVPVSDYVRSVEVTMHPWVRPKPSWYLPDVLQTMTLWWPSMVLLTRVRWSLIFPMLLPLTVRCLGMVVTSSRVVARQR